ncbi:MAG: type I restriction-modification system subunit M, partial [Lachnospiraceae bacterium]|nr:type I restriction-modification system subunit M [Lachnospiraceae bacterium]
MADVNKQKQLAQELSTKLWAMANDLRGNMEAYEFKNYILGLIFYKHLSDRTESFMNELLQDDDISYADAWEDVAYHDDLVEDSLSTLGYVLEPKYLFSNVVNMIENGTFTIDYMEEIINSITESTLGQDSEADFNGLFEDMDLKSSKLGKEVSQRGKLIGKIIQTIDTINFQMGDTDVDILGSAYITLIGNFASTAGKKGGEFYTPTNMSKLVARLATVGLSDVLSACDPACGSGSLLLQVGEYANVRKYYGQEMTSSTYNLARMNMILHDIRYQNFNIVNVDTLEDDSNFEDERFTVQVANPPYSTKWSADIKFLEDERFSAYGKLAPSSKADFAFVQHMIYHMADGDSRIAVLLPHG